MTTERQNQVIAEICGLHVEFHMTNPPRAIGVVKQIGELVFVEPIPNYHGDLNACAEMEKTLDGNTKEMNSMRYSYIFHVYTLCNDGREPIRATSAQRCEAFLRVHGKWEEA
jgi:hypothetical protein